MGRTRVILVATALSLSLFAPAIPVNADEAQIIDYCGSKSSGKVRAITVGSCKKTEHSLGNLALTPAEKRPSALVKQLNARYLVARTAAQKKGYDINITSGYRSLERQKYLFKQAVKKHGSKAEATKWVLPAEKSNHPWGLAIDVNYGISGTKARQSAAWLDKNGYKYGLCRRYINEWWHFEPLVAPGTKCPAMEPYAS
ncbi:MAG: D-alanyl-D-alanine carboxypeptidase family protein [Candidatus Nanopelagicales bacterium]|jgi:zinc D-Ala-D-Ala carboxypeptidase|nr:D-alanyl-D-alanine carboxypeptidase family protein [Candidatus Nanopelagicales bacterium]MDP4667070.1 D-alanyl-D-alanine carboxypeptidase family protein [Candidatus Nanopelagicales bacterium]MDP4895984.1 D-alanyl-D-alanine carboxypeptidase family protein [Candidatus Nanopelagicales bacterium]MDP5050742.1 D-alanyl-D-alanine carboxypeptidase family protein [Candidatus Nanopelagicales bacterium]